MNEFDDFIQTQKDEMTALLKDLVEIPSVMGETSDGEPFGKDCFAALELITDAAEKLGFRTFIRDGYYAVADCVPEGCDDIKLGILCHLDVVPAGDGWSYEPFKCTEKDGKLYGRGTMDDKGPAVSALYAVYAVKQNAVRLKHGVRLIFGTNEENGSADLEYYSTHDTMPPLVFTPDAEYPVINGEKGMVRTTYTSDFPKGEIVSIHGGQVINAVPSAACAVIKGLSKEAVIGCSEKLDNSCLYAIDEDNGTVKIECHGKSAHASLPDSGINAITGLLELLCSLPLDDFTQQEVLKKILRIYPHGKTNGEALGAKMQDSHGALTSVLSLIHTENGKIVFSTDTRFPLSSTKEEIFDKFSRAIMDSGIEITGYIGSQPHYTDENSELIKALLSVYELRTGKKSRPITIGGGTYVHEIDGGVAFGAERSGTDYHIHGADEFIPIDELLDNAAMFAQAILEICG